MLQGQKAVPAAQSQVIYSTVPLWSALIAMATLPDEHMGMTAWVGGALIFCASVYATRGSRQPQ